MTKVDVNPSSSSHRIGAIVADCISDVSRGLVFSTESAPSSGDSAIRCIGNCSTPIAEIHDSADINALKQSLSLANWGDDAYPPWCGLEVFVIFLRRDGFPLLLVRNNLEWNTIEFVSANVKQESDAYFYDRKEQSRTAMWGCFESETFTRLIAELIESATIVNVDR